ncbi:acyl-CoA reductase [Cyclobacterium jeungdonense]|uniref:Acyl-CoA reductase n=1 Tax=Cyclobacterium jeungdonense TaxID=708087 RepID=A0ABT8C9A3_9BACT|nr:acyl-CoA reductase [Cyclobacterium jeungdonense]MDN3689380.1 acyl-CoA reductase [Cyclobacterium jeungdonense]
MDINQRLSALSALHERLKNLPEMDLEALFDQMQNQNSWFTPIQSRHALKGITEYLSPDKLQQWASQYAFRESESFLTKNIGLIMAGNIPGVGFHDLLCVLVAGHRACVKLSSTDQVILPWLADQLNEIDPTLAKAVTFEERLVGMDAYIATGSDNSARYFDYYFGKYPHIIRKNRTSVAILDGQENQKDWDQLSEDIFRYFGLGCRNVSKVFFTDKDQIQAFMKGMDPASQVINHHKYLNNYEYNKSKYLVNRSPHLDNGHLLLVESEELVSPISVIYYELYADTSQLHATLAAQEDKIQCIVSRNGWWKGSIPLGTAQSPELDDYADKVDTLQFLMDLK